MRKNPVSSAYARALIDLADERRDLDRILDEIHLFLELLASEQDFRTFLMTPSIEPRDKGVLLDKVFGDRLAATLIDFIKLVIDKNRQEFLEEILRECLSLYDLKKNRVHVEATSAVEMAKDSEEKLAANLSANLNLSVLLDKKVRPEILGGLILRYGDLVVDGSVRTHLQKVAGRMQAIKLGSELVHEN